MLPILTLSDYLNVHILKISSMMSFIERYLIFQFKFQHITLAVLIIIIIHHDKYLKHSEH